jgi:hypothetical protein
MDQSVADPERLKNDTIGDSLTKKLRSSDPEVSGMFQDVNTPSRQPKYAEDGKRIITEEECRHLLGYQWPSWRKWMLLSSIFIVQVSMNFCTSVFPNAVVPISETWGVTEVQARGGQVAFLLLYAFGCELWAPWSEEFGRWPVLQ